MSSERVAEHELVFADEVLALAQTIQSRCSLVWQRNATDSAALGGRLDAIAHRAADRQRVTGEVHIPPAKREQLSEAQAGIGGDTDELGILGVVRTLCLVGVQLAVQAIGERSGQGLDLLG